MHPLEAFCCVFLANLQCFLLFSADIVDFKPAHSKVQLSDFELVRKVGQGGFGAVYVCRKLDTKEILALKIVNKSLIWKKNKVTQMKNERDVLASHLTTWMVQLAYSFQDPHYCYLAMEYCPGGDLRHLLSALGYLEEHEARLYMAEMILAVFSLHSLGYIHRDLKPDNFLIDSKGHLKLTDFGLSKDGLHSSVTTRRFTSSLATTSSLPDFHPSSTGSTATPQHGHVRSRTNSGAPAATPLFEARKEEPTNPATLAFSVVGSPHYMSPEVLTGEHGYGAEVDWWSLGCIFFELVTGTPPFVGDSPQAVFDAILDWKQTLPQVVEEYGGSLSPECMDFILRFLCESKERHGVKTGLQRIFAHPFFKDFDVESIFEMEPLFVPQLSDECDTTYFEANANGSALAAEDILGNEFEEVTKLKSNGMGQHGSPTEGSAAARTATASIQCPQTAPRRLVRHHRGVHGSNDSNRSSDEDSCSFPGESAGSMNDTSPSAKHLILGSYGRIGMARSRLGHQQQHPHGVTGRNGGIRGGVGSYTPLRRIPTPTRDIAGFTFQRKKSIRNNTLAPSIIKLDFDAEIPLQYLASSQSPASDSSELPNLSPYNLSSVDFSAIEITPKALVFGDEPSNITDNDATHSGIRPSTIATQPTPNL